MQHFASTGVRRLCASALDLTFLLAAWVVLLIAIRIFAGMASDDWVLQLWIYVLLLFLLHFMWPLGVLIYYVAFHAAAGWTPGKRIAGLRIVSHRSGACPSFGAVFARQFIAALVVVVGPLALRAVPAIDPHLLVDMGVATIALFAPVLLHPQGRGIHDLVAGTMVVKANEIITPEPGMPAVGGGW